VHRVNARIKNTRGNRGVTRRPRSEPGRYVFVGAIRCGHRGKSMFGNSAKSEAYYRCSAARPDYAAPSVPGHPASYSIREERVLTAVDR
jgi:Recombinase zinc beta ribbon domain